MWLDLFVEDVGHLVSINVSTICTLNGNVIMLVTGAILTLSRDSERELRSAVFPEKRKAKDNGPKPELQELFEKLHKLTGGKGKPVFTLARENKLKDLLTKHRLTEDNLITAATNIGKDDWLQGTNESHKRYGDVDYLLRPDKAARWAEQEDKKKKGMF
jgi:hypothetical protein